jgi:hypothetical protein
MVNINKNKKNIFEKTIINQSSLKFISIFIILIIISFPFTFALTINSNSIQVTDVNRDSAKISWTTDIASSGFIDYGTSTNNLATVPSTQGHTTQHFVTLTQLNPGTKYLYKVKASAEGNNPAEVGFFDFTTLLNAPSNINSEKLDANNFKVTWSGVSNAVKYKVYLNSAFHSEITANEVIFQNLDFDKNYNIKVSAIDSQNRESEFSNEITFKTESDPIKITFLDVKEITNTTALITWKTDKEVKSELKYGLDMNVDRIMQDNALKKDHSIKLENLKPDTRYYYMAFCGEVNSEKKFFLTQKNIGSENIIISNIKVNVKSKNNALVSWSTNTKANSKVNYGLTQNLDLSVHNDNLVTEHSLELKNLEEDKTYYIKVVSNNRESEYITFKTDKENQVTHNPINPQDSTENYGTADFVSVNQLPEITNNLTINVSGRTIENSRIYIFVNNENTAQIIDLTKTADFSYQVKLSSSASNEAIKGRNLIKVIGFNNDNKKDEKHFYINVDTIPPPLIINDLPSLTNQPKITVNGTSEPKASIDFYLDDVALSGINELTTTNFSNDVALGRTGSFEIKIVAKDKAGNENSFTHKIRVDKDPPEIEFENEFTETHFSIYRIVGTTKPGAKVTVINMAEFTNCNEVSKKIGFNSCEEYLNSDKVSVQLSPFGYALGTSNSVTADSSGKFEIAIPLMTTDPVTNNVKGSVNNLYIVAEDEAGNKRDYTKKVIYKPGCVDWKVGNIQSFPFNVYLTDLRAGNVPGSAMFPVYYLGQGEPIIQHVTLFKDKAEIGYGVLGKLKDMKSSNQMITIGQPKATGYDSKEKAVYIYTPVTINKYTGSVDDLPDNLIAAMGINLVYDIPGVGAGECELYPLISFDIQKPIDHSKWLSPEMINRSIEALDEIIDVTEKLADYSKKATQYGMLACGAMIAWNYIKSFTKDKSEKGLDSCSEQQREMERVYYFCDRVMCPAAPPKCDTFRALGNGMAIDKDGSTTFENSDQLKEQLEINNKWREAYKKYVDDKAKNKENVFPFERWKDDPSAHSSYTPNLGGYKQIVPPSYDFDLPGSKDKNTIVNLEFVAVGSDGRIKGIPPYETIPDKDGKNLNIYIDLKGAYDSALRRCPVGKESTLIITRKDTMSTNEIGIIQGSYVEEVRASTCVNKSIDNVLHNSEYAENGIPKSNMIPGCYNEECPQFDNTKCPNGFGFITGKGGGKDNINPAAGLWSSLRCVCFPALWKHLENYLKILKGAKKCLEQALIGETTAGFCERLLAQFICDIIIEAVKYFMSAVERDDTATTGIRGMVNNYQKNSEQIQEGLSNRYSGIVNERMGLSTDQLIHKACIFGITQDWSMIDGVFENYVEHIDVEPIVNLQAESRPYGYDPFTGEMSIGYNIYLGIVPGGETFVELYLECDPNFEGGKYCGANAQNMPITSMQLTFNSPAVNENFMHVDKSALYWYNKVVLKLKYKVGSEEKTKTITKRIWQKGDLAYNCHFSLAQGIQCPTTVSFGNKKGVVELKPFGHGSFLIPNNNNYFSDNVVAAYVAISNRFDEDFYIHFNFPSTPQNPAIQYKIPGSNQLHAERDLNSGKMLLYLNKIEPQATNLVQQGQQSSIFSKSDLSIDINESSYFKITNFKSGRIDFTCENSIFIHKTFDENGNNLDNINFNTLDNYNNTCNKIIKIDASSIVPINSELPSILQISKKENKDQYEDFNIYNKPSSTPTTTPVSVSSRKVEMDVLSDSGSGGGDTPILYDVGKSQKTTTEYRISTLTTINQKPKVQIIQPSFDYLPKEGIFPIGFIVIDDRNEIENITVTLNGVGQKNNNIKCEVKISFEDIINSQKCPDFDVTKGRSFYDNFYYELNFKLKNLESNYLDQDALYDLTVTAVDKGINGENKAISDIKKQRYKIWQINENVFEDFLIILGYPGATQSSNCIKCIPQTSAPKYISEIEQTTTPITKVRN